MKWTEARIIVRIWSFTWAVHNRYQPPLNETLVVHIFFDNHLVRTNYPVFLIVLTTPEMKLPTILTKKGVQEARSRLDGLLRFHQTAIINLKIEENSLTPICSLPPEILSYIFILAQRQFDPYKGRDVTQVCHYWREVGIGCPALWADLALVDYRWTELMLKRSTQVPLTIRVHTTRRNWLGVIKIVRSMSTETSRFKDVEIDAEAHDLAKITQRWTSAAPQLESLDLSAGLVGRSADKPFHLSDEIFGGEAPCLAYLKLDGCSIGWRSGLLQALTHLELHNIPFQPTFSEFLAVLERASSLETLHCDDSISNVRDEEEIGSAVVVRLPSLRKLILSEHILVVDRLLRYLLIPASAARIISCSDAWVVPEMVSAFSRVVGSNCVGDRKVITHAHISVEDYSFKLEGHEMKSDRAAFSFAQRCSRPILKIEALRAMCNNPALSSIELVSIDDQGGRRMNNWVEALGVLHDIKTVMVSINWTGVVSCLGATAAGVGSSGSVFFPNLRVLMFSHIRCPAVCREDRFCDQLFDGLTARTKNGGRRLENLFVNNSSCYGLHDQDIHPLVDRFVWFGQDEDGYVTDDSDGL
ncbi:hypothetical protein JAAARDRAFT_202742 [Jaapia argillacea MUCL 33604]|uniref:Uncharacterized protein n=1 Tax=Jaapia argillacea MUCL 33604 TaxID=933084 RepID=A0A067Q893_9AGAM|nr:hypothetical protein JAAARDRAFT_202742 [Jaapia argillacea MUCL 33604]